MKDLWSHELLTCPKQTRQHCTKCSLPQAWVYKTELSPKRKSFICVSVYSEEKLEPVLTCGFVSCLFDWLHTTVYLYSKFLLMLVFMKRTFTSVHVYKSCFVGVSICLCVCVALFLGRLLGGLVAPCRTAQKWLGTWCNRRFIGCLVLHCSSTAASCYLLLKLPNCQQRTCRMIVKKTGREKKVNSFREGEKSKKVEINSKS